MAERAALDKRLPSLLPAHDPGKMNLLAGPAPVAAEPAPWSYPGHQLTGYRIHEDHTPARRPCPLRTAGPSLCPFGGACHTCPTRVQAKLLVGDPGDEYEREADRVASEVTGTPAPPAAGRDRRSSDMSLSEAPPIVHQALHSPGQPLARETRERMESRLGRDLSEVRVHAGSEAAASARAVQARAYTVGRDIVLGEDQGAPDPGLLAHELVHVMQQGYAPCVGEPVCRRQAEADSGQERVWGGFRIRGDTAFVAATRATLNALNATRQGRSILSEIAENRRPWYRALVPIYPLPACGYVNSAIRFNSGGCSVQDRCNAEGPNWVDVPNFIYLFHEVVHAWLDYVKGQATHPDRECMTTGLGDYYTSIPYNENRLRCELRLPIRPCYDGECSKHPAPACGSPSVLQRQPLHGMKAERRRRQRDESGPVTAGVTSFRASDERLRRRCTKTAAEVGYPVEVDLSYPPTPRPSRQYNMAQLAARSKGGQPAAGLRTGLTEWAMSMTGPRIRSDAQSVWVDSWRVRSYGASIRIFIASEFAPNSCEYGDVLRHEQHHDADYRQNAAEAEAMICAVAAGWPTRQAPLSRSVLEPDQLLTEIADTLAYHTWLMAYANWEDGCIWDVLDYPRAFAACPGSAYGPTQATCETPPERPKETVFPLPQRVVSPP